MKYINSKILITGILLVFLSSCSKDFLDVKPVGRLTSDSFLKTNEQVKSALIGVYATIQYNYSNGAWASVFFMKNLPGDDVLCGSSEGDQPEYQRIDDFTMTANNKKIESIWSNFYKTISQCNTIINQAATDTPEEKGMVAEAKALRGMTYFDLVTIFGGVPIMTVNPGDPSEYSKPRATEDEVYAQVFKDFTEAIPDLPLKSQYSAADKFRMSKGAAQAFLGKAYVYHKDYDKAVKQLEAVINSGEYALEPKFADVWTKKSEFGQESLFEVSYTSVESYDWGTFPWGGGNQSNIECQLEGPRSDIFDLSHSTLNVVNGWGFNNPSAKIGHAFEAAHDSIRGAASVMSAADFEATGGVIKAPHFHDYEGYMRMKYVTRASESSTSGVMELNYTTNWRLMRYADVLLLAAEAYHFSGNDAQALVELNKVRARAKLAPVVAGADVFAAIVHERELELAFEASRFWDLVRWNMAADELSDIGFVAGKNEHFPIPQNEIIANDSISQTDQNPGY